MAGIALGGVGVGGSGGGGGGGGPSTNSSTQRGPQLHPAEVLHLIAIARCTEPSDVIEDVLDSLSQHSNRGQYIIVMCLEAKDPHAARFGEDLIQRYGFTFKRVLYYIHSVVEKEVPGKSSNINYGVRGAHVTLEKELGVGSAMDAVVVTVADCDAKISEHYFNELSVRYAASVRERREVFFAPPSLFDIETAEASVAAAAAEAAAATVAACKDSGMAPPPPPRDVMAMVLGQGGAHALRSLLGHVIPSPVKIADQMWSILVLQNLSSSNWCRLPCSTYSVGLRLIASVNYWDTGVESVPEDYHTALKIYWATAGRARCEPIFHPVLYQHINGGSWFGTVSQRFQQGIRHMWGATDLAYILWLVLRMPVVPFLSQLRIVATVTDVHISTCASAFLSTFAMPLLALLRPGYFATPLGQILLTVHVNSIWLLIAITLVTGAIYEWYATDMVRVCRRSVEGGGDEGGGGGGGGGMEEGGSSDRVPLTVVGTLPRVDRSVVGRLRSGQVTWAGAWDYAFKMLPWVWAPITAVLYLLGPAAVAQTKLMFQNRMRKAHVSPKSSPTPIQTPRPGGATPLPGALPSSSGEGLNPQQLTSALEAFAPGGRPIKLNLPTALNFKRAEE